jgi:hypothetical protein
MSSSERSQQTYWERKAGRELAVGMSKAEVLAWGKKNSLGAAQGPSLALVADPVDTAWPHMPCAKTQTMISLRFDQRDRLTSFKLGRSGVCL